MHDPAPHQIRTRRFPPSGSSANVTHGDLRSPLPPEVLVTWLQCQRIGHGSLQKLTLTRAAFARPGPRTTLFPDVIARMQPSDSLPPSATALVPLASGLPRGGRLFCASTGRRHVRPLTCRASETGHRLSAKPQYLRGKARASQVTRPSSSYVLWSNTPPDTAPSSPH